MTAAAAELELDRCRAASEAVPWRRDLRIAWADAALAAVDALAGSDDTLARAEAVLDGLAEIAGRTMEPELRRAWAGGANRVIDRLPKVAGGLVRAEALLAALRRMVDAYPLDRRLLHVWAAAVVCLAGAEGAAHPAPARARALLDELGAAKAGHPDDRRLRELWALAAHNALWQHLEQGEPEGAEAIADGLTDAALAFPDETVIRRESVRAVLSLIRSAAPGSERGARAGALFDATCQRWTPFAFADPETPATFDLLAEAGLWTGAHLVHRRDYDAAFRYFALATMFSCPARTEAFVTRLLKGRSVDAMMELILQRLHRLEKEGKDAPAASNGVVLRDWTPASASLARMT